MKIYTKRGDQGQTDLFGSGRVEKHHARVEAYGTLDECNAAVGVLRAALQDPRLAPLDASLAQIQNALFCAGSEIAAPALAESMALLQPEASEALEAAIDGFEAELAPLKNFILPGGSLAAAHAHMARTICRRAERTMTLLNQAEPLRPALLIYINRLSDYLFVVSRVINHRLGTAEIIWKSR